MLNESIGHTLISISFVGTKGRDGKAVLKAVLKKTIGHTLMSISPLGTKVIRWTTELKAMLKESIGHPLLSTLGTKVMGLTSLSRTKGRVKGVDSTYFTIH